jgi:hypothetical protein
VGRSQSPSWIIQEKSAALRTLPFSATLAGFAALIAFAVVENEERFENTTSMKK